MSYLIKSKTSDKYVAIKKDMSAENPLSSSIEYVEDSKKAEEFGTETHAFNFLSSLSNPNDLIIEPNI